MFSSPPAWELVLTKSAISSVGKSHLGHVSLVKRQYQNGKRSISIRAFVNMHLCSMTFCASDSRVRSPIWTIDRITRHRGGTQRSMFQRSVSSRHRQIQLLSGSESCSYRQITSLLEGQPRW